MRKWEYKISYLLILMTVGESSAFTEALNEEVIKVWIGSGRVPIESGLEESVERAVESWQDKLRNGCKAMVTDPRANVFSLLLAGLERKGLDCLLPMLLLPEGSD